MQSKQNDHVPRARGRRKGTRQVTLHSMSPAATQYLHLIIHSPTNMDRIDRNDQPEVRSRGRRWAHLGWFCSRWQTAPPSHGSGANGRCHQGQRRCPSTMHLAWQWHDELCVLWCTQIQHKHGQHRKKRSQTMSYIYWVCLLCIIECKEEVFVSSDFGWDEMGVR